MYLERKGMKKIKENELLVFYAFNKDRKSRHLSVGFRLVITHKPDSVLLRVPSFI